MLCSANIICRRVRIKAAAARQGVLEAVDNADFRCSKGQGGVIDGRIYGG
jgi:hypothetical protein